MMKRDQIESVLKSNGVVPSSPDEKIRSVLLSARYSKDEVDTAIMVLREDTKTKKTRVDGLHKVFRSSQGLNPDEISQLLGIEVNLTQRVKDTEPGKDFSGVQNMIIWVLSVVIALLGLLFYMYIYKIGLFHPSMGLL